MSRAMKIYCECAIKVRGGGRELTGVKSPGAPRPGTIYLRPRRNREDIVTLIRLTFKLKYAIIVELW